MSQKPDQPTIREAGNHTPWEPGYHPPRQILIIYYSRFGVVKALAELIAEGAQRVEGIQTRFLEAPERPVEELRPGETEAEMASRRAMFVNQISSADALIVGSPAYFGSMASPVKRLFEDCVTASHPPVTDRTRPWRHYLFRDKVGAAFTSSGTPHGGNELTLHSILTMLMHLGMLVVTPGQQEPILENVAAPYGATAIAGPEGNWPLTEEAQQAAREQGQRVAEVVTWLAWGRDEWERQRSAAEWQRQMAGH
jgi:NAD(P)H dehydrogenase (quinone)